MPLVIDFAAERWHWHKHPDLGFSVELLTPTTNEWAAYGALKTIREKIELTARKWFRSFEGIVDAEKRPIENTEANRRALLDIPAVFTFVSEALAKTAEWDAEKNADGGSAC